MNRKINLKWLAFAFILALVTSSASYVYAVNISSLTLSPSLALTPYDYLFYSQNSTYYLVNCWNKNIDYQGTNASLILNSAIALPWVHSIFFKTCSGTAYNLTRTVYLKSKINLVGESMTGVVFRLQSSSMVGFYSMGTIGSPKTQVTMSNFHIEGVSGKANQVGIELDYTWSNTWIEHIEINSVKGSGAKFASCYAIRIYDLEVNYCDGFGVEAYYCHGTQFDVKLYGNGVTTNYPNIALYDCSVATVTGASEVGKGKLLLVDYFGGYYSDSVNIRGMYFEGNTSVTIKRAQNCIVDSCRFWFTSGGTSYAMTIEDGSNATKVTNCGFNGFTKDIWIVDSNVNKALLFGNFDNLATFSTKVDDSGTATIFLDNYP